MDLKKLFRNALLVLGIGLSCYSSHATIKIKTEKDFNTYMPREQFNQALHELGQLMRNSSGHTCTKEELDKDFEQLQIECLKAMYKDRKTVSKKVIQIKGNLHTVLRSGQLLAKQAEKLFKKASFEVGEDGLDAEEVTDYFKHLSFALKMYLHKIYNKNIPANSENSTRWYFSTRNIRHNSYRDVFLYQSRKVYPHLLKNPTSDLINTFIFLMLLAWDDELKEKVGNVFPFNKYEVKEVKYFAKPSIEGDLEVVIGKKVFITESDPYYRPSLTLIGNIDGDYFSVDKNVFPNYPFDDPLYQIKDAAKPFTKNGKNFMTDAIKSFLEAKGVDFTNRPMESFTDYCYQYLNDE